MSRRRITIYFKPISKIFEVNDMLEEDEEMEINNLVYDKYEEDILQEAEIDYWEE